MEKFPYAAEQIDVLLSIIQAAKPRVDLFLDLGCNNGILGQAILTKYPEAKGILLYSSIPTIQVAKSELNHKRSQIEFITQDFGSKNWVDSLHGKSYFDVIVSELTILHQSDVRKKELYGEIYSLLKPGGIFLNLEQIASDCQWVEKIYKELFIDSIYSFHQDHNLPESRDDLAQKYYNRTDQEDNILTSVQTQCAWLRNLGFIHVDCFIKIFERVLFGGMRPEEEK